MGLASVRAHLAQAAPDLAIIETPGASASVAEAAVQHGVAPGQIARMLTFAVGGQAFLVVAGGDRRIDNAKMKACFGGKAHMLDPARVLEPDRPSGRRGVPVRAGHGAAGALRHLAARLRGRDSRGRLHPRRGAPAAAAAGRAGRRRLGRRLPRRLSAAAGGAGTAR